jgi:CrcB protein
MMSASSFAAVAIGGALGSVGRYWLAHQVNLLMGFSSIAWGTFSVNLIGSFAIGFILIALQEWLHAAAEWRLLLVVGFLGGFTTFSSFSWDTFALWEQGKHLLAGLNVAANVGLCFIGTALGVVLARWVLPITDRFVN